jgi:Flp pilus assembly protein TadG
MKQMPLRNRRAGTALVETALTLLLFTSILFSLVDFGYIMYLHQTLSNSAEMAARYGATNPSDTTGMVNYVLYHHYTGTGPGQFGLTSSNVSANRTGQGTAADRITITISGFRYPAISHGISSTGKNITVSIPVEAN